MHFCKFVLQLAERLLFIAVEFTNLIFLDVEFAALGLRLIRRAKHKFVVGLHLTSENALLFIDAGVNHLELILDALLLGELRQLFKLVFVLPHSVGAVKRLWLLERKMATDHRLTNLEVSHLTWNDFVVFSDHD